MKALINKFVFCFAFSFSIFGSLSIAHAGSRQSCEDIIAGYYKMQVFSASLKLQRALPVSDYNSIDWQGAYSPAIFDQQQNILREALESTQALDVLKKAIKSNVSGTTAQGLKFKIVDKKIILQKGKTIWEVDAYDGILPGFRLNKKNSSTNEIEYYITYNSSLKINEFAFVFSYMPSFYEGINVLFDFLLSQKIKAPIVSGVEVKLEEIYGAGRRIKDNERSRFFVDVLADYFLSLITKPLSTKLHSKKVAIRSLFQDFAKGRSYIELPNEYGGKISLTQVSTEELTTAGLKGTWLKLFDDYTNSELWWQQKPARRAARQTVEEVLAGTPFTWEDSPDEDEAQFYFLTKRDRKGNLVFDPKAQLTLNFQSNFMAKDGSIFNSQEVGSNWSNKAFWSLRQLEFAIEKGL